MELGGLWEKQVGDIEIKQVWNWNNGMLFYVQERGEEKGKW